MKIDPEKVRSRRDELGWSQERLAEKSGLSPRHLARIESEVVDMRSLNAEGLAEALDVNASDLVVKSEPRIIPQLLKAFREAQHFSRAELASRSNVSERQISRIEQSQKIAVVRDSTLKQLAAALEVDSEDLHALGWILIPGRTFDRLLMNRHGVDPTQLLSARVSHRIRLAYELVEKEYGPSVRDLLVLAPLMFVLLAEGSLAWRRRRLEEVDAAVDRLQSFKKSDPHLWFTGCVDNGILEEARGTEKESLKKKDVCGRQVREYEHMGEPADQVFPFELFLRKLAMDYEISDLVSFEAPGTFDTDRYWGLEGSYRLFEDTISGILGESEMARGAMDLGGIDFGAIPEELLSDDQQQARIEWIEDQSSDKVKRFLAHRNELRERALALHLDSFSDSKTDKVRRELIRLLAEAAFANQEPESGPDSDSSRPGSMQSASTGSRRTRRMKQAPRVSCHGMFRFMQRFQGLDADRIRSYLSRRRKCQITQVTDYEILMHLRHTRRDALKRAIRETSRLLGKERRSSGAAICRSASLQNLRGGDRVFV